MFVCFKDGGECAQSNAEGIVVIFLSRKGEAYRWLSAQNKKLSSKVIYLDCGQAVAVILLLHELGSGVAFNSSSVKFLAHTWQGDIPYPPQSMFHNARTGTYKTSLLPFPSNKLEKHRLGWSPV